MKRTFDELKKRCHDRVVKDVSFKKPVSFKVGDNGWEPYRSADCYYLKYGNALIVRPLGGDKDKGFLIANGKSEDGGPYDSNLTVGVVSLKEINYGNSIEKIEELLLRQSYFGIIAYTYGDLMFVLDPFSFMAQREPDAVNAVLPQVKELLADHLRLSSEFGEKFFKVKVTLEMSNSPDSLRKGNEIIRYTPQDIKLLLGFLAVRFSELISKH